MAVPPLLKAGKAKEVGTKERCSLLLRPRLSQERKRLNSFGCGRGERNRKGEDSR